MLRPAPGSPEGPPSVRSEGRTEVSERPGPHPSPSPDLGGASHGLQSLPGPVPVPSRLFDCSVVPAPSAGGVGVVAASPSLAGEGADRGPVSGRTSPAAPLVLGAYSHPPLPVVRIFKGGARVDFPSIPSKNPRKRSGPPFVPGNESRRGVVAGFSPASRRRLQRCIATLALDSRAVTMALTLPGSRILTHEEANRAFAILSRRFSSKRRFRSVSLLWKRELQLRGALHWHLLIYGVQAGSELEAELRAWLVAQWNSLVCSGCSDEAREHHRWWHARDENWQEVRDFSGYFAKYIGKDPQADQEAPVAGRWWGKWNAEALPVVSPVEVRLPDVVAVDLHRAGRKIRQKRADEGKMRAVAARLSGDSGRSPFQGGKSRSRDGAQSLSLWDLHRLRCGFDRWGRSPVVKSGPLSGAMREADLILEAIKVEARRAGVRPGKYDFRGAVPNTASMVVVGASIPGEVLRLLRWSYDRHGLEMPELLTRNEKGEETRKRRLRRLPKVQGEFEEISRGVDRACSYACGSRSDRLRRGRLGPAYAGSVPD